MGGADSLISVGRIVRPHGIRGEVKVAPLTDRPEIFEELRSVYVEDAQGNGEWVEIEGVRVQAERIIPKLSNIDDRDGAEGIRECFLRIEEESLALDEDSYHIHRLIGFDVKTTAGDRIGSLADIMRMPSQDVYVVDAGGKEILIPAVKEFVKMIDTQNNVIIIKPIEGLLE